MATVRPFAVNLGSPVSGTTQVGNLAVGTPSAGFLATGLVWFNGPDEDLGHIIGYYSGGQPTFWRSSDKTDVSFLNLFNAEANRFGTSPVATAAEAKTWLNANGYWSSYGQIATDGLTLKLDAADSSSYPGTGTTWYDLISPQQNITLIGSPTYTSGKPSYFTFDGSTQRGSGSSGTGVLPQTSYTKSVWFYLNGVADNNLVSSDTGGHFIYFAGGSKLYSGHANWGNYQAYPSVTSFNLNTWYYVALTFNTTDGMSLYINGNLDSTYTANKSAHSGDGSVNLAAFSTGNLLNGRIGKVYCYNRSLSADEVVQNYEADRAHFNL